MSDCIDKLLDTDIAGDPLTDELVTRALEQRVENGELELEPELTLEQPGR